jgi:hypothetical protein
MYLFNYRPICNGRIQVSRQVLDFGSNEFSISQTLEPSRSQSRRELDLCIGEPQAPSSLEILRWLFVWQIGDAVKV